MIFNIFRSSKRILLFLFEEKIIILDQIIFETIAHSSYRDGNYLQYFYPEVQKFIDIEMRNRIYKQIEDLQKNDLKSFEEKRKIGENDHYICQLIREDSIDEFISHVNQKNIFLSSTVEESIYETNSFLLKKLPLLIEYAAFFGSTQIFKYLHINGAACSRSIWNYAIHGRHPEIISFLEESKGKIEMLTLSQCLDESIKCHHNDVTEYILKNCATSENLNELTKSIKFYNFDYFPENLNDLSIFYDLCKYSHVKLVDMLLQSTNLREKVNSNEILRTASIKNNREIIQMVMRDIGIVEKSFSGCSSLTELTIPSSVRSIDSFAFNGCSLLTQISIPFSVTLIGKEAFYGCSKLEQLTVPSSVVEIGEGAFYGCSSLKRISISSSLKAIKDETFHRCSSLNEIKIPSSVKSIGNSAFKGCSSLTRIDIPNSVTEIGENAFCWCSSIVNVIIPESVKKIGKAAFSVCSSLTEIEVPSSVNCISDHCFSFCSSLKEFVIPYSVTSINDCAFLGCSSLVRVVVPPSVTFIGQESFFGCSALNDISTLTSVTEIEKDAFKGCYLLSKIIIPSSITSIGYDAFPSIAKVIQV